MYGWLHATAFVSTRRRAQECVFVHWKTFSWETFSLCDKGSYQEFYHLKKVQIVWLFDCLSYEMLLWMNWDSRSLNVQSDSIRAKVFNHVLTHFFTCSYFTCFYFFVLYLYLCKILSSLLSLIMTEVPPKRRVLLPFVFTSNCSKKPFTCKTLLLKHTEKA